jgi:hypothetical protein
VTTKEIILADPCDLVKAASHQYEALMCVSGGGTNVEASSRAGLLKVIREHLDQDWNRDPGDLTTNWLLYWQIEAGRKPHICPDGTRYFQ